MERQVYSTRGTSGKLPPVSAWKEKCLVCGQPAATHRFYCPVCEPRKGESSYERETRWGARRRALREKSHANVQAPGLRLEMKQIRKRRGPGLW